MVRPTMAISSTEPVASTSTPLGPSGSHGGSHTNFSTEQDRFLEDLEQDTPESAVQSASQTAVYPILQLLRRDLNSRIDATLSWEDLTGHELNFALVRPLAVKYSKLRSPAILYALLLTRIHFLRESERDLAYRTVNETRAMLCELLAIKLLRTFASDGMELVTALAAPFWPWQGADQAILEAATKRGMGGQEAEATSTLEYAIQSSAKKFVATPLVQKVVDGIWNGNVVLGNIGNKHALVDDSWKKRPVTLYDPSTSPLLDHRRLRVPRVRAFLEAMNFICIVFLYAWCLGSRDSMHFDLAELLFTIWLIGLAIDEIASLQEHGFSVYLGGSFFNVLDALFCTVGFTWLGFRISSLATGSMAANKTAFDILSLGAIILCPRLASMFVADNVLLLSLRAMIQDFFYFLALALVFFLGFTATFYLLAEDDNWSVANISWLLWRMSFGNTIELTAAQAFTPFFGPFLIVSFTVLAQTLLLTILISLLSSTFASVAAHAQEVSLYQHACVALSASSSDAVFSYVPPSNIICILVVFPASFCLTPRWLHKVNVWLIRATHLPILLAIRFLQQYQWKKGIELATEKSGRMLDNWGWKTKRSNFDIIESVFHDLDDDSAIPSELSNLFPASKPISKTYSSPYLPTPRRSGSQEDSGQPYHHAADDTFEVPVSEAAHLNASTMRDGEVREVEGLIRSSTWRDLAAKVAAGEVAPRSSVEMGGVPTSKQAIPAQLSIVTSKKKHPLAQQGDASGRATSFVKILGEATHSKRPRSTSPPPQSSTTPSPRRRYSLLGRSRRVDGDQRRNRSGQGLSIDSVLDSRGMQQHHEAGEDEIQNVEEDIEAHGAPAALSLREVLRRRGSGPFDSSLGPPDRSSPTSEILMRLLDRIDEQAQAVERLEALLKHSMKLDRSEDSSNGQGKG